MSVVLKKGISCNPDYVGKARVAKGRKRHFPSFFDCSLGLGIRTAVKDSQSGRHMEDVSRRRDPNESEDSVPAQVFSSVVALLLFSGSFGWRYFSRAVMTIPDSVEGP